MIRWPELLRNAFVSGASSALLSTGVLAWTGGREARSPFAPINAVSHWLFGDRAARRDDATAKYTLTGLATHVGASIFWSVLYELVDAMHRRRSLATRLFDGALVAAIACFVDYRLTPHRLQPGYEQRLSRRSLALVYAGVAVGLAAGAQMLSRNR